MKNKLTLLTLFLAFSFHINATASNISSAYCDCENEISQQSIDDTLDVILTEALGKTDGITEDLIRNASLEDKKKLVKDLALKGITPFDVKNMGRGGSIGDTGNGQIALVDSDNSKDIPLFGRGGGRPALPDIKTKKPKTITIILK